MYVVVSILPVSVIFILEFGNVLTARYFVHSIYCSDFKRMSLLTVLVIYVIYLQELLHTLQ